MTATSPKPTLKRPDLPVGVLPQIIKVDYLLKKGIYTPEEMAQVADLGITRVRSAVSWLKAFGAQVECPRGESWFYIEPFDLRSLVEAEIEKLFGWHLG